MAKDPVLQKLTVNKRARVGALKEFDKHRRELVKIVKAAHDKGEPSMTAMAEAAGMDRRTLYDLLKNDRSRRVGAGTERGSR